MWACESAGGTDQVNAPQRGREKRKTNHTIKAHFKPSRETGRSVASLRIAMEGAPPCMVSRGIAHLPRLASMTSVLGTLITTIIGEWEAKGSTPKAQNSTGRASH